MIQPTKYRPVMRYHGAKFRLAPWIISHFPPHITYVEPFGGAAGVFIQKTRSKSEVYNDLDQEVVNVFRVLRDEVLSQQLQKLLVLTPYHRDEFELAKEETDDRVESARRTLVRAFMGFGSSGATKGTTGFRIDSGRHYGTASYLWKEYPQEIPLFCERFRGVLVENKSALEIIGNHDRVDTLFYCDPPYMMGLRKLGFEGRSYAHEMTDDDHEQLINTLLDVNGMVVLSGYDNEMYNDLLVGWEKRSTDSRISAGRGTAVRTEVVWISPSAVEHHRQGQLFRMAAV